VWPSLKQTGIAYSDAVDAIDRLFAWYETPFPRTRLFRYCGLEAVDWHVDASSDLLEFASESEGNIFSTLYQEVVAPRLLKREYDAVGVTLVCQDQLAATATLALELRRSFSTARLILGGPLATMLRSQVIDCSFLHLFDSVHGGGNIDSLIQTIDPSTRTVVQVRNEWLSPDWSDVDWNTYLAPEPVIPVQATNGCPFSCKFCSSPTVAMAIDGIRYRQRPAGEVVTEIEAHVALGRRYFLLVGEILTWSHSVAIAEEIATRGLAGRVTWYFWTRTAPIPSPKLLGKLRENGCRRICFGLETTDAQALANASKQTAPSESIETLLRVVRADIQPHLFLMTGLPGQVVESTNKGILQLLDTLAAAGAYGVTTTVSPFEPEEWSPWSPFVFREMLQIPKRDMCIKAPASLAAEQHASELRRLVSQRLADQPALGAFGNVHQLVFLDRLQSTPRIARHHENERSVSHS
jgi:radical SAM superfamily enzyme YgiQ (UPF0313 family)